LDFVLKSPNGVTNKDVHIYFGIRKQKASYHLNKLIERNLIKELNNIYSPKSVLKNYSDSNAGCVGAQEKAFLNKCQRFDHFHWNIPLLKWSDSFFVTSNWNTVNTKTKGRIQYIKKEYFNLSESQIKIYSPILNFVEFTLNYFYSIKNKSCKLDLVINKFYFNGSRDVARNVCYNLVNLFLMQYQRSHNISFNVENLKEGPYEYRVCRAPEQLQGQTIYKNNYSVDDSLGEGVSELETKSEVFADLLDDLDDTLNIEIKGDISKVEALALDSHKRRAVFERKVLALLSLHNDELSVLKDYVTIKEAKDTAKQQNEMFG